MSNEKLVHEILDRIRKEMATEHADRVQSKLGRIVSLLDDIPEKEGSAYFAQAELAITSLTKEKPDLRFADELIRNIQFRVGKIPIWSIRNPAVMTVFGLVILLYIAIPVLFIFLPRAMDQDLVLGIPIQLLVAVGIGGLVGSCVSIMVRLQDFAAAKSGDLAIVFFTAFFKPIVGSAFALFVFALLKSGLLPIDVKEGVEQYFYIALSFVSGFSERFAKDVASKTEEKILGSA